jgi:hypothetical protein
VSFQFCLLSFIHCSALIGAMDQIVSTLMSYASVRVIFGCLGVNLLTKNRVLQRPTVVLVTESLVVLVSFLLEFLDSILRRTRSHGFVVVCVSGMVCDPSPSSHPCIVNPSAPTVPIPAPVAAPTYPVPVPPVAPFDGQLFSTTNTLTPYQALRALDNIVNKISLDPPLFAVTSSGGAAGGVVSESQAYGLFVTGVVLASWGTHGGTPTEWEVAVDYFEGFFNGWKKMCLNSNAAAGCQLGGTWCQE